MKNMFARLDIIAGHIENASRIASIVGSRTRLGEMCCIEAKATIIVPFELNTLSACINATWFVDYLRPR